MRVLATGEPPERGPCLYRDLAVGLGREAQDDFTGVNVGFDACEALACSLLGHDAVEFL